MDVNNVKIPSNSNSLQSANNTAPCDWQRALGICGKVDNLTTKNAVNEFPTTFSNSQTKMLPKSTRLSVHSDDDLGCFFILMIINFLMVFWNFLLRTLMYIAVIF